jgi:hypothetical protein
MTATASLFSPLKHAVLAFFKHDLSLRREDGVVRLVLEDRLALPAGKPPSRAEQTALKDKQELAQARAELAQILDEDPATRSTLRHLAFVEHALEKKGWRCLHKVPLEVLHKALEQLEGLVTNWSPTGLACLRSKMAVAVIDREHQDGGDDSDTYRTSTVLDNPPVLAAQAIETAKASVEDEAAALHAAYAALGTAAPDPHASADEISLRDLSKAARPYEPTA